jgi:hypothetical protein
MKFKLLLVMALSPVLSIAQTGLPLILSPSPFIQEEAQLKAGLDHDVKTPAQAR